MKVVAFDPVEPTKRTTQSELSNHEESGSLSIDQFGKPSKLRYAVFDFLGLPVGKREFLEFTKTYWNAFQMPSQRWAGCSIVVPTNEVWLWLLFPEDKPFAGEPKLWKGLPGKKPTRITESMPTDSGTKNEWFFWLIENPELHYQYSIVWDE